eukprot:15610804-Heterocapsa_arctica.AAC.1
MANFVNLHVFCVRQGGPVSGDNPSHPETSRLVSFLGSSMLGVLHATRYCSIQCRALPPYVLYPSIWSST